MPHTMLLGNVGAQITDPAENTDRKSSVNAMMPETIARIRKMMLLFIDCTS